MTKKHVASCIEVECLVDIQPCNICDLHDDELRGCIAEARKRKLLEDESGLDRDYVEQARQALMGGHPSDALCLLERALCPKPIRIGPDETKRAVA